MSEEKTVESFNCAECGLRFGIDKGVIAIWKKSHKSFVCPNGHTLSWKDITPEEKELAALRSEVAELKKSLSEKTAAYEELIQQSQKLTTELELWKPST